MSLIYCRPEKVSSPFYVESLGLHIYTSQELAYVVYNYPLLALDDFVDESLIAFIRNELDMEFLAGKLETWKRSKEDQDELLIMILRECCYYRAAEIGKFRQEITSYRRMHPAEYGRKKAETCFRLGQYGAAIQKYAQIAEYPKDSVMTEEFLGTIYYNLGACYARMFQAEKALDAFTQAYRYLKEDQVLQSIGYLVCLNPHLEVDKELKKLMRTAVLYEGEDTGRDLSSSGAGSPADQAAGRQQAGAADEWQQAGDLNQERWNRDVADALLQSETSKEVMELDQLFEQDTVKRKEGIQQMLAQWKQDYRKMA